MERIPFIKEKIQSAIRRHEAKRWGLPYGHYWDYCFDLKTLKHLFYPDQKTIDSYNRLNDTYGILPYRTEKITIHTIQAEYLIEWVENQKRMGFWDRVMKEANKKEKISAYKPDSFENFVSNLQYGLIYMGYLETPSPRTIFLDLLSGKFIYNSDAVGWWIPEYRKKFYPFPPVSKEDLALLCERGEINLKKISALDILRELSRKKVKAVRL